MKVWAGFCIVLLAFTWTAVPATAAPADIVYLAHSDGTVEPVDPNNPGPHAKTAGTPITLEKATGIAFTVTYTDVNRHNGIGFDDPIYGADRQARIMDVLNYLNEVLDESGACDILFEESANLGAGVLADSGTFFPGGTGFNNGYAFAHITTGVAPSATLPDIDTTVDFGWPWYQGTGAPPKNDLDFRSVILHEFTHGLGFISLSTRSGSSDTRPGFYTVWDSLLQTGTGKTLFAGTPPAFQGTSSDLVGAASGLVCAGANARAAFGSNPGVYAPNPFSVGSSLSHWDPSVHGVMDPAIGNGVAVRQYAPVDLGALHDIGYVMGNGPVDPMAAFTADVTSGNAPLTVHFTDQSTPGSQPIAQWLWSFGDSTTSAEQDPTHIYSQAGIYSVSLTVTTPAGSDTATQDAYIIVGGAFTLTPSAGPDGTISPSTPVAVTSGGGQTFTITPSTGYHIADVAIDGVSVGAVATYDFTGVLANHTISATFAAGAAQTGCVGGTTGAGAGLAANKGNILTLCLTCVVLLAFQKKRANLA